MRAEETIARNLAAPFGLTFHETACSGLRSCEAACDVAEFQAADPDFAAEACRKRWASSTVLSCASVHSECLRGRA